MTSPTSTSIVSVPIVKPLPPASPYGISVLNIFNTYTRQSFKSAFGVDAPPFDVKKPIKAWFDTTADPTLPTAYNVIKISKVGEVPIIDGPFIRLIAGFANVVNLLPDDLDDSDSSSGDKKTKPKNVIIPVPMRKPFATESFSLASTIDGEEVMVINSTLPIGEF